jgi:hypothetical protein
MSGVSLSDRHMNVQLVDKTVCVLKFQFMSMIPDLII